MISPVPVPVRCTSCTPSFRSNNNSLFTYRKGALPGRLFCFQHFQKARPPQAHTTPRVSILSFANHPPDWYRLTHSRPDPRERPHFCVNSRFFANKLFFIFLRVPP